MTEKRLYLLRHAKALAAEPGQADHDRPLAASGVLEAERIGRYLAEHEIDPDVVLCSTSLRTRQTESALRRETTLSAETLFLRELYLAPYDALLAAIRGFSNEQTNSLLLIGHNPGLEECATLLAGEPISLSTGALVILGLPTRNFSTLAASTTHLRGITHSRSLP